MLFAVTLGAVIEHVNLLHSYNVCRCVGLPLGL